MIEGLRAAQPAKIRISAGKTNQPIAKLFLLELSTLVRTQYVETRKKPLLLIEKRMLQ